MKQLSSGGLGRWRPVVRIRQETIEQGTMDRTPPGQLSAAVKALVTVGDMANRRIDEDVAGPGVKRGRFQARTNRGEVGDTPYVDSCTIPASSVQQEHIEDGGQGCSLPTG